MGGNATEGLKKSNIYLPAGGSVASLNTSQIGKALESQARNEVRLFRD